MEYKIYIWGLTISIVCLYFIVFYAYSVLANYKRSILILDTNIKQLAKIVK